MEEGGYLVDFKHVQGLLQNILMAKPDKSATLCTIS